LSAIILFMPQRNDAPQQAFTAVCSSVVWLVLMRGTRIERNGA